MLLDDGKLVYFGQHLRDAERIFSCVAIDNPIRVARKGIDKRITTDVVRLDFDHELLKGIEFRGTYTFKNPPQPYVKTWKNFVRIGDRAVCQSMNREEFLAYLNDWETRAQTLGARKAKAADLGEDEYRLSVTGDQFFDSIHIPMGPSRRSGGGGIWTDGWTIFFTMKEPAAKLNSVSAFCDQFNTVAR
jgi:hypothetical protein